MKKRRSLTTALLLVIYFAASSVTDARRPVKTRPSQDQTRTSSQEVSSATYDGVLDILYPRGDPDPGRSMVFFVLRFKPSAHPESQIVVRKSADGNVEVADYGTVEPSINAKLTAILAKSGKEDAAEMAKLITVNKRTTSLPASMVTQWQRGFFEGIASSAATLKRKGEELEKNHKESFPVHGTIYELWYEQSLNKIYVSLYDVEVDDKNSTGESKIVQWMNMIRREVRERK